MIIGLFYKKLINKYNKLRLMNSNYPGCGCWGRWECLGHGSADQGSIIKGWFFFKRNLPLFSEISVWFCPKRVQKCGGAGLLNLSKLLNWGRRRFAWEYVQQINRPFFAWVKLDSASFLTEHYCPLKEQLKKLDLEGLGG